MSTNRKRVEEHELEYGELAVAAALVDALVLRLTILADRPVELAIPFGTVDGETIEAFGWRASQAVLEVAVGRPTGRAP